MRQSERTLCFFIGFFLPIPAPSPSEAPLQPATHTRPSRPAAASPLPARGLAGVLLLPYAPRFLGAGRGPEGRGSRADFNLGVLGAPRPTALGAAILLRLCKRKGPLLSYPTHLALCLSLYDCSLLLKAHAHFTPGFRDCSERPLYRFYNGTLAFPEERVGRVPFPLTAATVPLSFSLPQLSFATSLQ